VFVKKCEVYINRLKTNGNLIAAQPIIREGLILSKDKKSWIQNKTNPMKEVQVGYYHIKADSLEKAIELAKENPEFEYVASASIEIHQVKTNEEKTDFVYPK